MMNFDERKIRMKIRQSWADMISRCSNVLAKDFVNYGGRGIEVCERWRDPTPYKPTRGLPGKQGFLNFLEDMGPTWFPGATIDRIDNDGDYTLENCQWLTKSDNVRKALKRMIENGTHVFLNKDWAKKRTRQMIENGTHNFLGGKIQRESNTKRVKEGTHNFLGVNR
mgnify:CR=1 FL=1